MSHSSSQTEIGSIHSQKSQQRELSCPVSWQSSPILLNPSDAFLFSPSWTHLLLPLNCGGFSDSKHSDAKEFPRGVVLLLVQRTPPPLPPPPPETMILQTRYSEHECNVGHHSLHQQTRMGDGWGVQTLPSSPRQPNGIYSGRHCMAIPPPSIYAQICSHAWGSRIRRNNVWTPVLKIYGVRATEYKGETRREKGLLFINIRSSILGCSQRAWSIPDHHGCPFRSINVSSEAS